MSLSVRSAGLIRALIYPIQFDENPLEAVDRVIDTVISARSLDATPEEYRAGIREALTSADRLSDLIPENHSDDVIRRYLAEVARRIEVASSQ